MFRKLTERLERRRTEVERLTLDETIALFEELGSFTRGELEYTLGDLENSGAKSASPEYLKKIIKKNFKPASRDSHLSIKHSLRRTKDREIHTIAIDQGSFDKSLELMNIRKYPYNTATIKFDIDKEQNYFNFLSSFYNKAVAKVKNIFP